MLFMNLLFLCTAGATGVLASAEYSEKVSSEVSSESSEEPAAAYVDKGWGRCATPLACKEHGEYKKLKDQILRKCTCDKGWGRKCCRKYVGNCVQDMNELCYKKRLQRKKFEIKNLLEGGKWNPNGPLTLGTAAHGLPPQLQGIYWLQDQEHKSSLMTFGPSRDGNGLQKYTPNVERQISVRTSGDRTWCFSSDESIAFRETERFDLVYHFEGTPQEDPTFFQIIPEWQNVGQIELPQWFLDFEMTLISEDHVRHKYQATEDKPAPVVWTRDSRAFGINLKSKKYEIVQVIDGLGQPTSAFQSYLDYNEKSEEEGQEWRDGMLYYHEAVNDENN